MGGWGWNRVIESSLTQCSPADGGLRASCVKQSIALPVETGAVTL